MVDLHLNKLKGNIYLIADLKGTDPNILSALFNLCLATGKLSTDWKMNRTTLIPKKTHGIEDASNWRPISISSVNTGLFTFG